MLSEADKALVEALRARVSGLAVSYDHISIPVPVRMLRAVVSTLDAARAESTSELLEALKSVRAIIAEGAAVGFLPAEGDWAERLFSSQQKTSSAISRAEGLALSGGLKEGIGGLQTNVEAHCGVASQAKLTGQKGGY